MKLCIFSGTFNPIHNAHLQMAEYVLEHYGFDKIIFIPAYKPPHKDYDINMCKYRYDIEHGLAVVFATDGSVTVGLQDFIL